MSTLQDDDQFLVQRGTNSYKQSAVNLMSTILDTDLMLVQRGADSFSVSCEDVKDQLGGGGTPTNPPALNSVVLEQDAPINTNRFTGKSFTTTAPAAVPGGVASTLEMTATVTGAFSVLTGSDPITNNAYSGTADTDIVLTLSGTINLGDVSGIEVGDTVKASGSYTPQTDTISSVSDKSISTNTTWSNFLQTGAFNVGNPTNSGVQDGPNAFNNNLANAAYFQRSTTYGDSSYLQFNYSGDALLNLAGEKVYVYMHQGIADLGARFRLVTGAPDYTQVGDGWLTQSNQGYMELGTLPSDGSILVQALSSGAVYPSIYAIKIGDLVLTNGNINVKKITLSLPTEKDIKLFQAGDVVQQDDTLIINNYIGKPILTNPEVGHSYGEAVNAFDGDETTTALPAIGNWWIFQMPNIPVTTSFKIWYAPGSSGLTWLKINNATIQALGGDAGGYLELTKAQWDAAGLGATFDTLDVGYSVGNEYCYLNLIEIDGKKLVDITKTTQVKVVSTDVAAKTITVDGGTWVSGDRVSATSPKRGEGTVSDITGTRVTITPFTDNCFKENQHLTVAKAVNVDPKTDKITSYNDSTKVITVDSETDLLQFADGDSVFMTDNSGTGASTKTGYKLTTDEITNVESRDVTTLITPYEYAGVTGPGTAFDNPPAYDAAYTAAGGYCAAGVFTYTWTFAVPWDMSNAVYMRGGDTSAGFSYQLTFVYEDGTNLVNTYATTAGYSLTSITPPTKPVTSITIDQVTYGVGLIGFYDAPGNAVVYDLGDPSFLTFADNTDLEYFRAGDVVQYKRDGNRDETWSNYWSANAIAPAAAHDGKITGDGKTGTYAAMTGSASLTFTLPADKAISFQNNVQILVNVYNVGAQYVRVSVSYNGGAANTVYTNGDPATVLLANGPGTFQSFTVNASTDLNSQPIPWINGVYVDGELLLNPDAPRNPADSVKVVSVNTTANQIVVDGGKWEGSDGSASDGLNKGWNQDQVWSANVINNRLSHPATNAFDGNPLTAAYADVAQTTTVTFASAIPVAKLRLNVSKGGNGASGIILNGTFNVADQIGVSGWNTITGVTSLQSISYTSADGNNFTGIYQIEVNSALLVDQGIAGAPTPEVGDTKVEYQTTGGVGTVATDGVNITNKTITLTESESGDARWIADNKAGIEFKVATAAKPAIAATAHLKFDAAGAVTGYTSNPVPARVMSDKETPTLTFPTTFSDTGTAPDAEFSDANSYIQTKVQLKNAAGSSALVRSNTVIPSTTTRTIESGEVSNNAEGVGQMFEQLITHEQRIADHSAKVREEKLAKARQALKSAAARFPTDGTA